MSWKLQQLGKLIKFTLCENPTNFSETLHPTSISTKGKLIIIHTFTMNLM